MKKFCQTKNLESIFDLSADYFQKRMKKDFLLGIHYFVPETSSKTKKAVLWDIKAVENWIRGIESDSKLDEFLQRR